MPRRFSFYKKVLHPDSRRIGLNRRLNLQLILGHRPFGSSLQVAVVDITIVGKLKVMACRPAFLSQTESLRSMSFS